MANSTATKLDAYEPQVGLSTVITNTSAVTDEIKLINASTSQTEPLKSMCIM